MPVAFADEIRAANERYHDHAAGDYDRKWGISYAPAAQELVVAKLEKALGRRTPRFARALEVGAGTGYFTLNLVRAGVVGEAVASDISPGMLQTLSDSARRLELRIETVRAEASALPFDDASFDLIFGHAVLHHLPDLPAAFAEFARLLRPGGEIAFCGEPSERGDRLSNLPKRAALAVAPAWRRVMRVDARRDEVSAAADDGLEHIVDVHAFAPSQLSSLAEGAGLCDVRVSGEELVAGWFGWVNRTLESTARPNALPGSWYRYAHRGYLLLKGLDDRLLEPRLPPSIFYNLLLSARRPATGAVSQPAQVQPRRAVAGAG